MGMAVTVPIQGAGHGQGAKAGALWPAALRGLEGRARNGQTCPIVRQKAGPLEGLSVGVTGQVLEDRLSTRLGEALLG